jgi:uncharacterized protein (DUF1330 family)
MEREYVGNNCINEVLLLFLVRPFKPAANHLPLHQSLQSSVLSIQHRFRTESFLFQWLRDGQLAALDGKKSAFKEEDMKKGYWVVAYLSVRNQSALKEYGKLAVPAIEAGGGRLLIRTSEVQPRESGVNQRLVVTEFDSLEKAIATYNTAANQSALRVLGSGAERDFRIVEGV